MAPTGALAGQRRWHRNQTPRLPLRGRGTRGRRRRRSFASRTLSRASAPRRSPGARRRVRQRHNSDGGHAAFAARRRPGRPRPSRWHRLRRDRPYPPRRAARRNHGRIGLRRRAQPVARDRGGRHRLPPEGRDAAGFPGRDPCPACRRVADQSVSGPPSSQSLPSRVGAAVAGAGAGAAKRPGRRRPDLARNRHPRADCRRCQHRRDRAAHLHLHAHREDAREEHLPQARAHSRVQAVSIAQRRHLIGPGS